MARGATAVSPKGAQMAPRCCCSVPPPLTAADSRRRCVRCRVSACPQAAPEGTAARRNGAAHVRCARAPFAGWNKMNMVLYIDIDTPRMLCRAISVSVCHSRHSLRVLSGLLAQISEQGGDLRFSPLGSTFTRILCFVCCESQRGQSASTSPLRLR